MIHLGYFSFDTEPSKEPGEPEPWHGSCSCVVEAGSSDDATEQFKSLLHKLHNTEDLFDDVKEIYLHACVEIRSIPTGGFLAHYSERSGESPVELSTWLRGVSKKQADVYHLAPESHGEGDQEFPDEPFVVFEPSIPEVSPPAPGPRSAKRRRRRRST